MDPYRYIFEPFRTFVRRFLLTRPLKISRRATWNLVRRAKKGRVVVLTTHFSKNLIYIFLPSSNPCFETVDEADVLGDRVAIMSHGRLRCVGSPLWLKARFGVGYHLDISTMRQEPNVSAESTDTAAFVTALVAKHVPSAELISKVALEV
jgi:ABC-type multidrug transport system ATPase subunit